MPEDESESETDWSNYESGPFCRHFSDPADCEQVCKRCGHGCNLHWADEGNKECSVCECGEWEEGDDE